MTTLFLVYMAPFPPKSGAPLRSWQNINILANRGPVHVVSFGSREPGDYAMPRVAEWIHIDAADFPRRDAFSRWWGIVRQREFPVPDAFATHALNERIRGCIERIQPDLIVLSHWRNALPKALSAERYLLDMHNVESMLALDWKNVRRTPLHTLRLRRWRRRERELIERAAKTWVCGENDVRLVARLDDRLPAPTVWPNAVDLSYYAGCRDGTERLPDGLRRNGATVVFVGAYRYEPNRLAAEELIERIFPAILERIPHARIVLVGDGATERMRAAAANDGRIVLAGFVDDVRPYLSLADVSVIPLRTGGGTRLKIVECFAAGVPVVSTAKGAEGLDALDGRDIRITEEPDEIANAAVELLQDPDEGRKQAERAFRLAEASLSWNALEAQLADALPQDRGRDINDEHGSASKIRRLRRTARLLRGQVRERIVRLVSDLFDVHVVRRGRSASLLEEDVLRRFLADFRIDCVFDVGANAGQYASRLRSLGYDGAIVSIEPIPALATRLKKNAARDRRWYVESLALSDVEEKTVFNVMAEDQFSSLSRPRHDETKLFDKMNIVVDSIELTTARLDSLFERYRARLGFQRPFLKMDTQGNDLAVARGAGKHLTEFIGLQSELAVKKLYEDQSTYRESIDFYESQGFALTGLFPNNDGHFPELIEFDCIMYNRADASAAAGERG